MGLQLGPHGLVVGDRVAFHRRHVDEVDQHRAALDVGEELVAEPGALGRAFDQARDVGDDRLPVLALDRPQDRRDRREGVVGDLRRRPRQPAQQRGLAGVGQPDQADVGEQLQPQLDPVRFAAWSLLGEARRLARRGGEAIVAVPAAAAVSHHRPLPGLDQVDPAAVDRAAWVPGRYRDLPILPPRPVPVRPFPVSSPLRPEVLAAPQRPEVAPRRIADENDVSPVPSIAAVGPTARNMSLPPERDRPVAAAAALNPDFRLVVHRTESSLRA